MDYVEIQQEESEDTAFYKSLRECNVPPDLTIEGKDGSVFVHRAVLRNYSPLIEKKTKIEVKDAHIEDLSTLVRFYYEGKCVVQRERLYLLLELATTMKFEKLQMKIEDITKSQYGMNKNILEPKQAPYKKMKVQEQKSVALQQAINIIMSEQGKANQCGDGPSKTEEDLCEPTNSNQQLVASETAGSYCFNGPPALTEENEDEFESYSSSGSIELISESFESEPVAAIMDQPEEEVEEEHVRHSPRKSRASQNQEGPRVYNIWTKAQNEIFFKYWLEMAQTCNSDANYKMAEELAKVGLCVSIKNITARKQMFKRLYKNYRKGRRQAYVRDYLEQIEEILSIESNRSTSSNNNGPSYMYNSEHQDLYLSGFEEGYLDSYEDPDSYQDADSYDDPDYGSNSVRRPFSAKRNSSTSGSKRGKKTKSVCQQSTQSDFAFTPEMINVLLKTWLKYVGENFRQVIAPKIVDALAEKNFKATIKNVVIKKNNMMRNYCEYRDGKHRPSVIPYVLLLEKICAKLQK